MDRFFAAITVPIRILNGVGFFAGAIWLMVKQEWSLLGSGILTMFVGGFILSLLFLPGLGITAAAARLLERRKVGGALAVGAIGIIYTFAVVGLWSVGTFWFYVSAGIDQAVAYSTLLALMAWGYGVATGPLTWLAAKEQGNEYTQLTLFFAQLALVVAIASLVVLGNIRIMTIAFLVTMAVGCVLEVATGLRDLRGTMQVKGDKPETAGL